MADSLLVEAPPDPNLSSEFDSLAIPPMDTLFFSAPDSNSAADLTFPLDDNGEFLLNFDDFDDLQFPPESDPFVLANSDGDFSNCAPDSGSSGLSVDHRSSDINGYLNCSSPESGSSHRLDSSRVSSQGSGVSVSMNAASPDSGNTVVDQKIKVEDEPAKGRVSKRKKENDDTNTGKCRRSSLPSENINTNALSEEEEKKRARLMRNRESAQLSRQRKKHYVEELEDKVRSMHSTITDLNNKIAYFMAENTTLRQQLGGGGAAGMCPPPHMYPPMAPVAYPWMPCAPYVMKPQGSQMLVPIPRLKPQQPVSASKAKKTENKKSESKTKKVASVSFLGLLFFIMLFGGLVPIVNVRYGGIRDDVSIGSDIIGDGFYDLHRGRVLQVNGLSNKSDESKFMGLSRGNVDITSGTNCGRGRAGGSENDVEDKGRGADGLPGSNEFVHLGNGSEPLVASLYVPRNDKLVKIDGNLIIHSVLASEKAMASKEAPEKKNERETGLVIPGDFSPALIVPDARGNGGQHPRTYRNPVERQKALSSGSADALKDHIKSTAADGKMQQWFREGLAGPMLSSGMCTEVFQFDVSPAPGAIVPASSVTNVSAEHHQNVTELNRVRNRRILHGLPVPFSRSDANITGQHGRNSQKENFQGNKTASSMVVSVLVDPREVVDGDMDGMIAPKSLSRIFVVVLLDSVKYVTYSCVLPRSGPHLVTT